MKQLQKQLQKIKLMKGHMIPVGTRWTDEVTHGKDGATLEDNGEGLILVSKAMPGPDGKTYTHTTGVPIARLDSLVYAPEEVRSEEPRPEDPGQSRRRAASTTPNASK